MIIHINRANDIVDGHFRPVASCPTVADAAAWLVSNNARLPLYVEAQFRVEPFAPVSIEKQMAAKVRRLKAIAAAAGRVLSRIEPVHGMTHQYRALLAR